MVDASWRSRFQRAWKELLRCTLKNKLPHHLAFLKECHWKEMKWRRYVRGHLNVLSCISIVKPSLLAAFVAQYWNCNL
jgi:hypothetical protein